MIEDNPPNSSSQLGSVQIFWTFDMVEGRLVEAVRCRRRLPGGGRWPFAGDGPWHLIRKEWWDWDARDPAAVRQGPPTRAEIGAMEEAEEWLTFVADEGKRLALAAGIVERAKGAKRVGWTALVERLKLPGLSGAGLEWRYSQAVRLVANVLNALAGHPYASRKGDRAAWPSEVAAAAARVLERAGAQKART